MNEKVCTLSVDHAIRIAKIIATAPVARMPMITQLFQQASVDLEGLEELIENSSLTCQRHLKMQFFAEMKCHFSPGSMRVYTALITVPLVGLKPVKS